MHPDISRDSYFAERNVSRVLFQQGRPHTDADLNEAFRQQQEALRALTRDMFGPFGGPDPHPSFGALCGFEVIGLLDGAFVAPGNLALSESAKQLLLKTQNGVEEVRIKGDFLILPGRYYVGGHCLNVGRSFEEPWQYTTQPDWRPRITQENVSKEPSVLMPGRYLVVLDVWEQHAIPFELLGLADPALGGVDTTHRARIVWEAKTLPSPEDPGGPDTSPTVVIGTTKIEDGGTILLAGGTTIAPNEAQWAAEYVKAFKPLYGSLRIPLPWRPDEEHLRELLLRRSGQLLVHWDAPATFDTDFQRDEAYPTGFRGQSNQLYRVEIHEAEWGPDDKKKLVPKSVTFKWSRNNGSTVFRIRHARPGPEQHSLQLELLTGRYSSLSDLQVGGWVEVLDRAYLSLNPWRPVKLIPETEDIAVRPLLQIVDLVEDDLTCTIVLTCDNEKILDPVLSSLLADNAAFVRVWDHPRNTETYQISDEEIVRLEPAPLKNGAVELKLPISDRRFVLEQGLAVEFRGSLANGDLSEGDFQPGDFWLIPARSGFSLDPCHPANDESEWRFPERTEHYLAPLALIKVENDGKVNRLQDLRVKVTPRLDPAG